MLHRNLPLKAASLLLAIVLWFWVLFYVENPIIEFPVKVELVAAGIGDELTLGRPLPEVEVRVRGLKHEVEERNLSLHAYVSCRGLEAGNHKLDVRVDPVEDLTVVGVRPEQVAVVLEDVISKEVPVEAELMGDPREGYELAGWVVSPKTVVVTGPRSLVDRTKRARAAMDLMGVFPDVAVAVDARALDSGGSPVEGVTLTPPKVNVQVRMTLAVVPRTVPVFLRTSGTLAPGLEIASVSVEPKLVTILGAANRVEEVDYVETSELPLRAVQRSFMRELPLVVPNGVTLLTDPVVMVTAKVKQVEPREPPPAPAQPPAPRQEESGEPPD